mmetsp:Transcript_110773/g.226697  ORF Transcript_110773/g.226697 Transcript_110773/m.226697 type:complete len:80 (+) Transcript_110773:14-253(+)
MRYSVLLCYNHYSITTVLSDFVRVTIGFNTTDTTKANTYRIVFCHNMLLLCNFITTAILNERRLHIHEVFGVFLLRTLQ